MGTVKGSPLVLLVTTSVFLITALHSVQAQNTGYHLIGPGACRGPDWGDDEWPLAVGDRTLEKCSEKCHQTEDCTSFSLGKGEKAKKPCLLYGHEDIQPASSLGGECYKIAKGPPKKNGNEEDDDDDDDNNIYNIPKPIKNRSSYILYINHIRPILQKQNPNISLTDLKNESDKLYKI